MPESRPQGEQTRSATPAGQRGSAKPGRLLRWIAIAAGGSVGAILLVLLVIVGLGITIDLSGLRGRIEQAAAQALDRRVAVEGPVQLVPSFWPTLQVEGIRVINPEGWVEQDLARLGLARAKLSILALLGGDLRVEELTVSGLAVNLERNATGEPNWLPPGAAASAAPEQAATPPKQPREALRISELQELSLTDISLTYRDAGSGDDFSLRFDEISGDAELAQPMHLSVRGAVQEVPYQVSLTAGSLSELLSDAPWALDLSASAVATELSLRGEITHPLRGRGLALDFVLTGPETEELERLLGVDLPPVRSLDLSGRVTESEGIYRLSDLKGVLGGTAFSGELDVDTDAEPARLRGVLEVPSLDVGPIVAAADAAGKVQTETDPGAAASQTTPQQAPPVAAGEESTFDVDAPLLSLAGLKSFEADLTLSVGTVLNAPVAIEGAVLKVHVAQETLTAPMSVTVADVSFNGELRLAPQDGEPAARVVLTAQQSDIGGLASLAIGAEGIEGGFGAAELIMSARGVSVRSLVESAALNFSLSDAALSYGHEAGERSVEFTLDDFQMQLPASGESRITAAGALLGEAFSLDASGGTFTDYYIGGEWPVAISASGGGANLSLEGKVRGLTPDSGSDLAFLLEGKELSGLSTWLGVAPDAEVSYALNGVLSLRELEKSLRIEKGQIGNSVLAGSFGIRHENESLVAVLDLAVDSLDTRQLARLLPQAAEEDTREASGDGFTIDVPILPQQIDLADSDIDLAIKRIAADPVDITDVSLSARIREGFLEKAPIAAVFGAAAVQGSFSADLRGEVPSFGLTLSSKDLDVGGLLGDLGLAQDLEATAAQVDFDLTLRGASLRYMLQHSDLSAAFRNGLLRLRDPNTADYLDIHIPSGRLQAPAGEALTLDLEGLLDEIPVTIGIRTDSIASLAEPKDSLGASLEFGLLNAGVELTGTAPLPLGSGGVRFELALAGESLGDFDELFDASLPPWGPYKLTGAFGSEPSGYFIEDLRLTVGSSTMTGAFRLDTTAQPPNLEVDLIAERIQVDDFDTADWSATEGDAEQAAPSAENQAASDAPSLLSPEVLQRLDGRVSLKVDEVLSGENSLGSGDMVAQLSSGRISIDPLKLNVPGGSVEVGFALRPTETLVELEARAKIDRLDYSLLARHIDPESTTGGLISVDIDFSTRGPNFAEVMGGSNGHIDFAVWPKDLNAGLFDLWAVNLFTAMLPSLDSEASKVNCLVGRFALEDGIMQPTAILLDTSRIQASAAGTINFKDNTIDVTAAPRSKKPEFFSAQTPIQVKGHIEDFELGVSGGAILGTAFRVITSPIVVPFEWIFTEKAPEDGKVACETAWGRAPQG